MITIGADHAISAIVTCLEGCWASIRDHHPDLPRVAIIVATGTTGRRLDRWGHFAGGAWVEKGEAEEADEGRVSEVMIAAEGLSRPPEDVMRTLLHESAHALGFARGIKNTSRGGRYHNAKFEALADEVGLTVARDKRIGRTTPGLRPDTLERYRLELDALREVVAVYRDHPDLAFLKRPTKADEGGEDEGGEDDEEGGEDEDKPKNKRIKVCCACEPARSFRISPSIFELGGITCDVCGEQFTEEG